jgi:hypothetical protein
VGAFFLNRGHFDLFYHWLALVAALSLCVRASLRAAPGASPQASVERPARGQITVHFPGMRPAAAAPAAAASPAQASVGWRTRTGWR